MREKPPSISHIIIRIFQHEKWVLRYASSVATDLARRWHRYYLYPPSAYGELVA